MSIVRRITGLAVAGALTASQLATMPAFAETNYHPHSGGRPQAASRPAPRPTISAPAMARSAPPARIVAGPPARTVVAPPHRDFARGGDRDHRDYRGRRFAGGLGAAAIIGSIIAYSAYRGADRDSVYDRCARNFPDFDYDTGTFQNEDGDRETCPYLVS